MHVGSDSKNGFNNEHNPFINPVKSINSNLTGNRKCEPIISWDSYDAENIVLGP